MTLGSVLCVLHTSKQCVTVVQKFVFNLTYLMFYFNALFCLTGKEQHGNRYDIQIQSYAAEP